MAASGKSKGSTGESKPKAKSRAKPSLSKADAQPKKRRRTSGGAAKKSTKAEKAAKAGTPPPTSILVVDNGGDTLKYGWIDATQPLCLPNVTARLKHQWTVLVGDELRSSAGDPNQMHFITRSTERGIVTNLGNQVQVWKRMLDLLGVSIPNLDSEAAKAFGWKATRVSKSTTSRSSPVPEAPKIPAPLVAVLLLVPPHYPRNVLDQMMYVWMEDFGVGHVGFANSQVCATQPHPQYLSGCLVDLGWSATHIVPTFRGTTILNEEKEGRERCPIRRIPVGGRHLVNAWKYYASYRQWNLMDQEWILRDVFEKLGYVSLNFRDEIEQARRTPQGRRPFDRNFVLPDYQTTYQGRVELTEAMKREAEALKKEQARQQLQKQQEEQNEDEEESDEDFEDPMEEDVELEVECVDEGKHETENDLAEAEKTSDDDKDETKVDEKEESSKGRKRKKGGRKKKTKLEEDHGSEDDDLEGDESDGDNKDMLRQRLLRQKQEEERRRREIEAEQQMLNVSVERFTVPEMLFLPSDVTGKVEMAGLAHSVVQSIKACPKYLQPALFRSIQLTGGVAQLPNLMERLERDVRALAPAQFEVKVSMTENTIDQAWLGATEWVRNKPYTQWSVSRDEWMAAQKRKAWMKLLVAKGGILV